MKKTLKRALIIMAVVMTAVLMMAFAASAATCADGTHVTGTTIVEPTCEEAGYTQTYCTVCGTVFGKGDYKEPLGHDGENATWGYKASGDHYVYEAVCARENCGVVLNDGITYYLVELKNPWVAKTYCADVPYAQVAETFVGEAEAVTIKDNKGSSGKECAWYVKSGDTVEDYIVANYENIVAYNDNNNTTGSWLWNMLNKHLISRIKDKDFGLYTFTGWTTDAANLTAEFDIENKEITQNTTLYAKFTGDPEVYYTVQFHNATGMALTRTFDVRHGQRVDDSIFLPDEDGVYANAPKMPENEKFYYEFKEWNIDISALYGQTTIIAVFDAIPKMYEYIYCDYLGNPLQVITENGEVIADMVTDEIAYGEAATFNAYRHGESRGNLTAGIVADGNTIRIADLTERPKDRTYLYTWFGEWSLKDGYHITSSNAMIAPLGYLDTRYKDTEEYKPIYLIPKYTTKLVLYSFDLTAVIPATENNPDYYLDKIIVQITNDKGQHVASGMTKNVNGKAVFVCGLNDSQYYNITAITEDEKYVGKQLLDRQYIYDNTLSTISTTIYMDINEDYLNNQRCSCIHHNPLFKPIWVRILNILYRLFNIKYVCCDDMYATMGDLLIYTR